MSAAFAGLGLHGSFRPYQELALAAFERDRAAGRRSTHVVAPPGSGKTVLGLEIIRRLGQPALVLAPTTTIQQQWSDKLSLFTEQPDRFLGVGGPLHVYTYQTICQTIDPGGTLRDAAIERLVQERAAAAGLPPDEVRAQIHAFRGHAATRFERDIANTVAGVKREIARGDHLGVDLDMLLRPSVHERVRDLVEAGVGTLVLDECHHLASMWGYLIRTVIGALKDVHVVGLTATSPSDLPAAEANLYHALLGPVDFTVPTPAVVRDGYLAPYQELAYFTTPLDSERAWLDERHLRFAELLDRLHEPPPPGEDELAFGPWVIGRIRYRDTAGSDARLPFATFAKRRPELARAGLRYFHQAGLPLPDDAPRGEGWREPPTLDDWIVLLSDYTVGCLRGHPGEAAERRLAELRLGLADLGFVVTRAGVRRGGSDVDRVLTTSAAKSLAAVEVLAAEHESRADGLRAVILCDTEHGQRQPEESPLALSGGARGILRVLGGDVRTAVLRPIVLTGETLACLPADAERHAATLAKRHPDLGAPRIDEQDGLAVLGGGGWTPRRCAAAAGGLLASGATQVIVGTRGLLGEGWDAPRLNVLVDLTSVAADVSVRQMRGRAVRLDPTDQQKLASNWDVVCVAPDLARGVADYQRFVRRHSHLHAPCEDGSIETGISHVHPALSPFAPPEQSGFGDLNTAALARSADLAGARARWRIGTPYVGEDVPVLLVRRSRRRDGEAGEPAVAIAAHAVPLLPPRLPRPVGAAAALRRRATELAYPTELPLDRVAATVAEAYLELGEISAVAAASVVLTPRAGGMLRCSLASGDADENARFTAALEEAISPAIAHRYLVSRPVRPAALTRRRALLRYLGTRPPLDRHWHPVPSDLGRNRKRAQAYHRAWRRYLGRSELVRSQLGDAGAQALLAAAGRPPGYTTSRRQLWH